MTSAKQSDVLLSQLKLGQATEYNDQYDASLLQSVPRSLMRDTLSLSDDAFVGHDIWTAFELSWLTKKGKPQVAIAEFYFAVNSPNLVESKSFKLYLNSFNQTKLANQDELQKIMQRDLKKASGGEVSVILYSLAEFGKRPLSALAGTCIDDLDINVSEYNYAPELLKHQADIHDDELVEETLSSDLLKSNCLVTGQPDWASVQIYYQGKAIDHAALLRYLISFRGHNEFHEHCVERIYCDIKSRLKPQKLRVYARFTRRGGLDINPIRASHQALISERLTERTPRQ
ncbi:NADPH-dependent 7-cyano-7-deazaguanine reductase QueF [Gayadomonas joobiniege]|uniref:NADPH-dependent 7-cyano-7-deazaguanine reductase QueF n=1 Tax=Gayadomonas joobiniege TaxID=1234606 RepID=UPI000373C201|nr:NADPH-dependent 7-cyano-7-deazaguanine reductase QueF [Gayadomonas joobiniege]